MYHLHSYPFQIKDASFSLFKALIHLFGHSEMIAIYSNNLSGNKSLLKSFTRKHYFLMFNHNFRRSIPGCKAVTLGESQSPNDFELFSIMSLMCRKTFQWLSWLLKERYRQICTHFCPRRLMTQSSAIQDNQNCCHFEII